MRPHPYWSGMVLDYWYLWKIEDEQGQEEGSKPRPVCLVFAEEDEKQDVTHLFVFPLSGTTPMEGQRHLVVPETEIANLRRKGRKGFRPLPDLNPHKTGEAYLHIGEYNYDVLPYSAVMDYSIEPFGKVSPKFLELVQLEFRAAVRRGAVGRIDRTQGVQGRPK